MQSELEQGKRERDRLLLFEKEVIKKREDSKRDGSELTKEGLEKDIAKVSDLSLPLSLSLYALSETDERKG